jgi:citrate lyase gamma subunit
MEPMVAFRVREHDRAPALVVRVNFGMLTSREATRAEIDDLAHALRELAPSFQIVSEHRHEFGNDVEASLHQVVIEMDAVDDSVAMEVIGAADRWARACFEARHLDL